MVRLFPILAVLVGACGDDGQGDGGPADAPRPADGGGGDGGGGGGGGPAPLPPPPAEHAATPPTHVSPPLGGPDVTGTLLYGLVLRDGGEQLVKVNPASD